MFENSKWICRREKKTGEFVTDFPAPYVVKDIHIAKAVQKATLNVCALGEGAYFMDGARIPDSFRPTYPSEYEKTIIYNTYDVTNLLSEGGHRFGAILGNHRFIMGYSMYKHYEYPMLIFQLDIEYADGTAESIVSDESSLTHPSPVVFNCTLSGEMYDARLEIKDWCTYGADTSSWNNAELIDAPKGSFRTTICPPIRTFEENVAKEIKPGLFDFGIITAGHVRIKISGKRGAEISVVHGELLTPDGMHPERDAYAKGDYHPHRYNTDIYILDGEKDRVFEQLMSFHGFQYVEVEGEYDSVEVTAITAHTDIPVVSDFECSDGTINKIHKACVNSMLTCYQDAPLDNPKRDAAWLGDVMLDAEMYMQNFDTYDAFYELLYSIRDLQGENGCLTTMAPGCFDWIYDRSKFIGPDWGDSAMIHIAYYMYKYTGKTAHIAEFWDSMEKTMEYFRSLTENGIYMADTGTGDWSSLGGYPVAKISVMSNYYYIIAAEMMSKMAAAIGKDSEKYNALTKNIREAVAKEYSRDGQFVLSHITERIGAVYVNLLGDEESKRQAALVSDELKSVDYEMRFGVHGIKMIFDAMTKRGYGQLMLDMVLNDRHLGYAKNVKDGLTALPERFDYRKNTMMSANHHFFSMVDGFFYKYLAGIKLCGAGFSDVCIEPVFVDGIDWVKANMLGIEVSYDKDQLTINSPYAFTLKLGDKTEKYPSGSHKIMR